MKWVVASDHDQPNCPLSQEIATNGARGMNWLQDWVHALTHCPLCIGLALLSAIRTTAHLVMIAQLERRTAEKFEHPASVLGTVFQL